MQNAELLDEVLKISADYHTYTETPLGESALKEDLILRPLFNLDQQLDHMSRNFANNYESDADKHYIELEEFLFNQGVIENKFMPKEYVTDKFMKLVSADPELRAYSYLGTGTTSPKMQISSQTSTSTSSGSSSLSAGSIVGIVLGVFGGISLLASIFIYRRRPKTPATEIQSGNADIY